MLSRSGFDSNYSGYDYIAQVGSALGNMYGYKFDGVYQSSDFNVTPDSEVIAEALTCWTLLSGDGFTHSTTNPRHCIDYIFSLKDAKQVEVESCEVLTEGTADLSDHFPVKLTVKF